VVIDTPGQIEAFSQSASGQIFTDSLACTFPTCNLYLVDTVRCESPITFCSNMLYALSILYKSKVPLLATFNKIDILNHEFAVEWMRDFDKLDQALSQQTTYMASFSRSMALTLDEFYRSIDSVGVSASMGKGFDKLCGTFESQRDHYFETFYPEIEKKLAL
jgi:hypothetical protein